MATKKIVYCLPCAEGVGCKTKATALAPQKADEDGTFHWVPICVGCADGWFDPSEGPETFPGPIVKLDVVLHE